VIRKKAEKERRRNRKRWGGRIEGEKGTERED
jgi:hypothetical protein